jgi:beta-lactamase class A
MFARINITMAPGLFVNMKKYSILLTMAIALSLGHGLAQPARLRQAVDAIAANYQAKIGIAYQVIGQPDSMSWHGNDRFPMQSVFKFHLALAVLDRVDRGKFTLDMPVRVSKADMAANMYSPLRNRFPEGDVDVPLRELLALSVGLSDNVACDVLFRLMGGPKQVQAYLKKKKIPGVAIAATETDMHRTEQAQYLNWSTPRGAAALLVRYANGEFLSETSQIFLWEVMASSPTGANRMVAGAGEGSRVVHKTGTSGTDANGVMAAVNHIGVVILPNGTKIALAIFVSQSAEPIAASEQAMAEITRAICEAYR